MVDRRHQKALVLVSAVILSLGLGSIHAFSVLLEPLEVGLRASRADIAPAYSIGLASLTLAVLVGHRLYQMAPPSMLPAIACCLAASGLVIAAKATQPLVLWLGYGMFFGFANGVGYGFSLYVVNLAFERFRGLAMGGVTAVYAVGASGFAKVFDYWATDVGAGGTLFRLSVTLILFGAVSSCCLGWSRFQSVTSKRSSRLNDGAVALDRGLLGLCWLIYGTGVAAGLMAMGHAAGIVKAAGGTAADGVNGAVAITSANALGGFLIGYLADRQPAHRLLVALGVMSATALLLLVTVDHVILTILSLAAVGFSYGSIIALFPVVTAAIFGRDLYALAYGRIFTSWGLAGLAAPWFAGLLYSHTAGYGLALSTAALLASISGGMSFILAGKTSKTGS